MRRRVSKRGLSLILCCLIIVYYLSMLLYYQLNKTVKVELVNNVNVILHHQDQDHHQHQDQPQHFHVERLEHNFNPEPVPVPIPVVQYSSAAEKEAIVDKVVMKQNVNYMHKVLDKMEKSMKKDEGKMADDLAKLPNPKEMLAKLEGPVAKISVQNTSTFKKAKIIVISRENTGYPVLGQFFTQQNGFFVHGEPPVKTETVLNLFNCVLLPEMVLNFSDLIKTDFGSSSYFSKDCLLESDTVCQDPLSYETKCSSFPYQILKSKHFSLEFVRELLEKEEDIRVIYLIRDPRGVLKNSKTKPGKLCSQMSEDWDQSLELLSSYPGKFHLARYEALAVSPLTEVSNLFKSWNITANLSSDISDDIDAADDDWSQKKNSVLKVNSWKTGLTSSELKLIENSCVETLSKMEYQLLGSGVV